MPAVSSVDVQARVHEAALAGSLRRGPDGIDLVGRGTAVAILCSNAFAMAETVGKIFATY